MVVYEVKCISRNSVAPMPTFFSSIKTYKIQILISSYVEKRSARRVQMITKIILLFYKKSLGAGIF
jgi:hypothetical protein